MATTFFLNGKYVDIYILKRLNGHTTELRILNLNFYMT